MLNCSLIIVIRRIHTNQLSKVIVKGHCHWVRNGGSMCLHLWLCPALTAIYLTNLLHLPHLASLNKCIPTWSKDVISQPWYSLLLLLVHCCLPERYLCCSQ